MAKRILAMILGIAGAAVFMVGFFILAGHLDSISLIVLAITVAIALGFGSIWSGFSIAEGIECEEELKAGNITREIAERKMPWLWRKARGAKK